MINPTLVMDAINSDKSWEEIRDLLWLKLCNAISIPIPGILWISNSGKRNLLLLTSTCSKQRQRDATSEMMLPLLGILSKD